MCFADRGGAIHNYAHIGPQILQRGYAAFERCVFQILQTDLIERLVAFAIAFMIEAFSASGVCSQLGMLKTRLAFAAAA